MEDLTDITTDTPHNIIVIKGGYNHKSASTVETELKYMFAQTNKIKNKKVKKVSKDKIVSIEPEHTKVDYSKADSIIGSALIDEPIHTQAQHIQPTLSFQSNDDDYANALLIDIGRINM